ncbi:nuclear transport factor 2 family protein [Bradyrhizobium sp. BRP14]|nr:nuclear transport factor 2 family protein [Bradyrhizobium sp. BRP14]
MRLGDAESSSMHFKAEEIWASEDRGVIRWQLRWEEGEKDRTRGVNIMRVRDGKIVEGMGYVGVNAGSQRRRNMRTPESTVSRCSTTSELPMLADCCRSQAGPQRSVGGDVENRLQNRSSILAN